MWKPIGPNLDLSTNYLTQAREKKAGLCLIA